LLIGFSMSTHPQVPVATWSTSSVPTGRAIGRQDRSKATAGPGPSLENHDDHRSRGDCGYGKCLWRYSQHLFHSYGQLWLSRNEPVKALAYADECLAIAEETSSNKYVVKGRRLRGQAFLAQGCLDNAEQELFAALQLAIDLANPPQLWKTHAAVGDLRRAQGRTEDARRSYGAALSVIEAMAASLTDAKLRETLRHADPVEQIRCAAQVR
jgi:tetratricopeptide (TPR) repeat protein